MSENNQKQKLDSIPLDVSSANRFAADFARIFQPRPITSPAVLLLTHKLGAGDAK